MQNNNIIIFMLSVRLTVANQEH